MRSGTLLGLWLGGGRRLVRARVAGVFAAVRSLSCRDMWARKTEESGRIISRSTFDRMGKVARGEGL